MGGPSQGPESPSTETDGLPSSRPGLRREAFEVALVTTLGLALAMALAIGFGVVSLPSLITPGGLGPAADLIAKDFGADAVEPELTGYDGQQVYAIARYFPDLDAAAEHLDRPAYRMLRILTPALASVAPPGGPTVVALLAANIMGVGVAIYAGARIIGARGGRPVFAAPAAAVLLLGVATTTVGPVAWGLCVVGLHLALEQRHRAAIAVLVLAALTRETAAVAAACFGAGLWLDGLRLRSAVLYLAPGAAVVAWYGVLTQLVDNAEIPNRTEPLDFLSLDGSAAAVAAAVAGIGLLGTYAWRDTKPISLCTLAFTGWMLLYTDAVLDPIALLRVNGLAIVLGLLGLATFSRMSTSTGEAGGGLSRSHGGGGSTGSPPPGPAATADPGAPPASPP